MNIKVEKISNSEQQQQAFLIRMKVFVEEQNVPREEELDENENISTHFLAYCEGIPCGTARWRFTPKGIKLERFAVLKEYRGKNVGERVLNAVLEDIAPQNIDKKELYLHAQVAAMPFYAKAGFRQVGEMFEECDIQHFKMIQ
jgi:predicted GNAT family N-acyltransferase